MGIRKRLKAAEERLDKLAGETSDLQASVRDAVNATILGAEAMARIHERLAESTRVHNLLAAVVEAQGLAGSATGERLEALGLIVRDAAAAGVAIEERLDAHHAALDELAETGTNLADTVTGLIKAIHADRELHA